MRFQLTLLFLLAFALACPTTPASGEELIPRGASWRYLDDGSDQGTAWREPAFDDASWPAGPAQLGYGDGDEATVIGFGEDPDDRHLTTYFRHTFTASDPASLARVDLYLVRDDGAVVYLNGFEVFRSARPEGPIDF